MIRNLSTVFETFALWVRIGNQPDRKVLREIHSPGYDAKTLRHHIMLLELEKQLFFTSGLLPACLANEATENLFDTLLLNGYTGSNYYFFKGKPHPVYADNDFYENLDNKVISNEQCSRRIRDSLRGYTAANPEDLCTSFQTEATFTWAGIVGGPLQTVNTRSCMYTLVGVMRLIYPARFETAEPYTNVYSRVTAYLDWIEHVVWGNETVPEHVAVDGTGEAPTEEVFEPKMRPVHFDVFRNLGAGLRSQVIIQATPTPAV